MDFDDVVSPIGDEEELQPGQIYFALPLNRLKRRLQPEEMAALAVKASSALMKTADKCGCRKKSICPVALPVEKSGGKIIGGGGGGGRSRSRRRDFTAMLSAIPE